ncbi:glutathione transferase GstA [Halomonas binhaiensis]|uniref:Glutathione transferase GstA n=1 Tax=Halomonas binhaiensis TaxID=2562282 RepID=A0A5C1NHM3_9GAMM|nr:glutathione transferase GstA [Halomonas binhaiensis]QEM81707.1 glutathione transferase GstA [Halomonas binhaiensis]
MKLFFAPDTCSLSPHIILRELGLPFELVRVNNKTKRTADGRDFYTINPKGYVAALLLDNGEVLTEGPAILQYLADLQPEAGLAPPSGTWERVRLQEWLNFITSELHGGAGPLFNKDLPDKAKEIFKEKLFKRLDHLEVRLDSHPYVLGEQFSIADAYLYTVLLWMRFFAIDLGKWPSLQQYLGRIGERASVREAISEEAKTQPVLS